jgi:hypothetical protein
VRIEDIEDGKDQKLYCELIFKRNPASFATCCGIEDYADFQDYAAFCVALNGAEEATTTTGFRLQVPCPFSDAAMG